MCRLSCLCLLFVFTSLACAQVPGPRIWWPRDGELVALDPLGRVRDRGPNGPWPGFRSVVRDGRGRALALTRTGTLVVRDAFTGSATSFQIPGNAGPMVVDAADRVWIGDATIGTSGTWINGRDAGGAALPPVPTWGGVQDMVLLASRVAVTVETRASGSSRLRTYDLGSGSLLAERGGAALATRLAARPTGGLWASQVSDPSIAPWSGTTVLALDLQLDRIGGFDTTPEIFPGALLPTDGGVLTAFGLGSPQGPTVIDYDAMGRVRARRATPATARHLWRLGTGDVLAALREAHAPAGTRIEGFVLDEDLHIRARLDLGTGSLPGHAGDPTAWHRAAIVDPLGDIDTDGLSNGAEIARGTDPTDPLDFPAGIQGLDQIPSTGGALTFTLSAPEDPGRAYLAFWSGHRALFALDRLGATDLRIAPTHPFDANAPYALDPLFALSTLSNLPLFQDHVGTLDATGAATLNLTLPPLPGLQGAAFDLAFVVLEAGRPNGLRTLSRRHTVRVR